MKHVYRMLLCFTLLICFQLSADNKVPLKEADISPILNGSPLPAVQLEHPDGKTVSLENLTGEKGAVIVFYRGGWCPYCNRQLAGLGKIEKDIASLGLPILAISPDQPSKLKKPKGMDDSRVQLLSDRKMAVSRAFGIAFKVDEALRKKYLGYGIDLEASSGEKHHQLPVPSVFLVDSKNRVAFSFVHPNYKVRLSPDVLLAAAKDLIKP